MLWKTPCNLMFGLVYACMTQQLINVSNEISIIKIRIQVEHINSYFLSKIEIYDKIMKFIIKFYIIRKSLYTSL